ncbi:MULTISPECIES: hypothetical protein [unclassified Microcoleus]|uniref:hypothetical protein n=1 Tax=unclassified Microcoleus TaxID=2642155 RepID=UPI0025E82E5D|nr:MULTISPECIES: hypothetical protein [unclassified Microcoleus]
MPPEVIFGNAGAEGASRGGWFAGHFIMPEDDARSTSALEPTFRRCGSDFFISCENLEAKRFWAEIMQC